MKCVLKTNSVPTLNAFQLYRPLKPLLIRCSIPLLQTHPPASVPPAGTAGGTNVLLVFKLLPPSESLPSPPPYSATRPAAWLGSSHKTGAASNTSLFPRLARAAPACPGLTQRGSWELLLLPGQGWMTCLSSPPNLSLRGAALTWRDLGTTRARWRAMQRGTQR